MIDGKNISTKKLYGEFILKVIGHLLTLGILLVGIYQFNSQQRENDQLEFKRNLWNEQLTTYSEICETAGRLVATSNNSKEFDKYKVEFYALYWGRGSFVSDAEVEFDLKEVHLAIQDFIGDENSTNKLKYKIDKLVKSCRKSVEREWQNLDL